MSKVWISADLHIGHKNIHKYRNFPSSEEHDDHVLNELDSRVGKNDTLILAGDIAFTVEALQRIKALRAGNKILVMGNHCSERVHFSEFVGVYDKVHSMLKKGDCWITHAPLHADHLRGKFNIHGHLHDIIVDDSRYACVSLEQTMYRPVLLERVVEGLREANKCIFL